MISFLNELKLICLYTSIEIVSTQLNGFNYCYLTLISILIFCLRTEKWLQILLFKNNYSIENHSFAHSQMFPIIVMKYQ